MERMKIEGIKLSNELVAIIFDDAQNKKDCGSQFCRLLAGSRVNLPFLSVTNTGEDPRACFCVALEDQDMAKGIIAAEPGLESDCELISSVGLITVFHHQFSLGMLGLLLNILGKGQVPIYGLASSLSTLNFITDYAHLNRAVQVIQDYFSISFDQIYARPDTPAVYREPKIKTYGFSDVLDLSVLELEFQLRRLPEWGLAIYDLGNSGIKFELVLAQYGKEKYLRLSLVFKQQWKEILNNHMRQAIRKDCGEMFHITSPAELVYFFGPHFGERYGIANSTFSALTGKDIPILLTGCSGSVVYLVLPEGKAQGARTLLSETFENPSRANK